MAVTWLKTGAESTALAKQNQVAQEMKKAQQGKLYRFWLKIGEECRITFVDGELNSDGYLEPPRFYEHQVQLNGSWQNWFVCPHMTAPHLGEQCPICAGKDIPYLASVFTIIDHRQFQSSKDPSKVYKDTPKLLVAKDQSMELLQKVATKRGGLAGCTFDVSRLGDKSANIGSMFEFVEKSPVEELQKKYIREVVNPTTNAKTMKTFFVPANYEEEIPFFTGEELTKMGLGAPTVSGYTPPGQGGQVKSGGTDYSSQL